MRRQRNELHWKHFQFVSQISTMVKIYVYKVTDPTPVSILAIYQPACMTHFDKATMIPVTQPTPVMPPAVPALQATNVAPSTVF